MKTIFATAILGLALVTGVQAQGTTQSNVDLSTVPSRDSVQLTIYNSEDLTLVRETRVVSFKKGVNPLQFSWANTLIDPTSVRLRFVTHPEKLELLDTTFPHTKPQMLYWNVQSETDGEATVEITYFTSGVNWSADYLCIANPDETEMGFEGFVRVFNNSGRIRKRPGPAGRGQDQSGGENRSVGPSQAGIQGRSSPQARRTSTVESRSTGCVRRYCCLCGEVGSRCETKGNHQGGPERILHLHD